jgi:hypothetical protein
MVVSFPDAFKGCFLQWNGFDNVRYRLLIACSSEALAISAF